ncbi:hypothetical protein [Mesomycoplasma ovipneumoniae]|uniref:hypothetical protein n=1 Tax=Mesomycoplasma ovipneumoniae TaxID=29562 RepID=UPI003080B07D
MRKCYWILAIGSLLAQSELTQIVIDNFLPSSVKDKINVKEKDRKNMDNKLKSPVDFPEFPSFKLGQRKLTLRCWLFLSEFRRKLTPKVLVFLNFQMQQKGEY